jgi:hypothetical protein
MYLLHRKTRKELQTKRHTKSAVFQNLCNLILFNKLSLTFLFLILVNEWALFSIYWDLLWVFGSVVVVIF